MTLLQQNVTLLVIEDNPGDFVLIEEYLDEAAPSSHIQQARTYQEAKELLSSNSKFDAILLDLTLPDLSGEELVSQVLKKAGNIPIIVLTGFENQEFGLKTLSMGVTDYVLKNELSPFVLGKVITYGIERNRIRHNLKKSEEKYRDTFNLSPHPMFLVEMDSLNIIDANKAAFKQYGYSKQEFIALSLVDIHPEDQISVLEENVRKVKDTNAVLREEVLIHQRKNGETFYVEISTNKVNRDGQNVQLVLAKDISDQLEAEHALAQKSRLLAANAKVTGALIENENWKEVLDETFEIIGKALKVDRVYYFENHFDKEANTYLLSQRLEWTKDSTAPQLNNPDLQNIEYSMFPNIMEPLIKNRIFQTVVSDLDSSDDLKPLLEAQNIISILCIPIFVDDKFYGFIGFDDCEYKRVWNEEDIQYLRTLTSNVSSAIKLRNTTDELKLNEYKFKSMVEEGGDLIEILDSSGNFTFISPNLPKILGWEADELLEKNAFDYIHPEDRKVAKVEFRKLLHSSNIDIQPFRFQNKNGSWDWLKCSGTNLLDDEIINGILITASDITEQKYYNELQKLERDVLENNALNERTIKQITDNFLTGIEHLHSGIRTSVSLILDNKIVNFSAPSLPQSYLEKIEGETITDNKGSCATAAYRKEQVISTNIFEDPIWEGYRHLGEAYNFAACWSVPIFNNKGEVRATFAVYYEAPTIPSDYEHNTVERAAHILRILFEKGEKDQAEQELAHREKRFKALVQEGSDLIGILDKKLRFKYVSPSIGDDYEEFLGIKAIDLVHPEDHNRVQETLELLKKEKRIVLSPYRLKTYKGDYIWVETIITDLLDEPAVNGYVANSRNVTKQIKRENKLRELSLVAAKTTDGVVITNNKGLITWVNSSFEKLSGYTLDEIEGKKPGNFLQGPETDRETVKKISEAIRRRESVEVTLLNYNKSGDPYWLYLNIDPIFDDQGNTTHFIAVEKDVTEKIKKEKELQESLERYDIVNKATSDTIWDLDFKTDQMLYNTNIYDMFGYTEQQVKEVGSWWRKKIHPDDLEKVDKVLSKVLKNGDERIQFEYRFKAADGSYKYILDRAFVIKDDNEVPVRMIGAMQDITQEREEEERLKLLESVITNTSEAVVILNANKGEYGREIIFTNNAFTKLTGYNSHEVIGETLHFLNGPDTDTKVIAELKKAMDNYEASEVEFINYKKNGEKIWINTSVVPIQDNNGRCTHWVAIGRDITEQKKIEKEIRASLIEKETLLAEIHHRVKNNLAVVSGMMQLQAFESENDEIREQLYDSVVRIKTMATVHELLYQSNSFSQLEFSQTLKNLVQNISDTLQTGSNISLKIDCDPIKLNINQAIPASLIVNEVITNAYKHAFKDRKTGEIRFQLSEANQKIRIEITDNGSGFEDKDIMKSGSLGIHLINVLSEQIEGELVYENFAKGTRFCLTFKRNEKDKGIGNSNLR